MKIIKGVSDLRKIFTSLIILFPILSMYSVGISSFTIADFIMIILTILLIIPNLLYPNKKNGFRIYKPIFFISMLIIFHFLFTVLINKDLVIKEIALTTIRYSFYLFFLSLFTLDYFDINFGFKLLKRVTMFSTMFLLAQFIAMRIFHFYLPGFIPGIPLMKENYSSQLAYRFYQLNNLDRPYSIFEEPSHFAMYVVLYFAIALFDNNKKEIVPAFLIVIGIVISKSAAGYLIVISLILVFIFKLFKRSLYGKETRRFIKYTIAIPLGIIAFIQTSIFDSFTNRFQSAFLGRFQNLLEPILINNNLLIGNGMIGLNEYLPGISRLFLYFGVVGFFVFLSLVMYIFMTRKQGNYIVLFILLVSTIGTEIIFGKFIVLYLPFIIIPFISLPQNVKET